MLAEQRRDRILEILGEKGSVSVNELYHRLKVSRETIRRDITRLDTENRLRKTHGGALTVTDMEPAFDDRLEVNRPGKKAIGEMAASLVPDGASLIIDAGTTTLRLAEALGRSRKLTVITNDIQVSGRLAGRNENKVLLLGGELQGMDGATTGRDATEMLSHYLCDFAFIGASALSPVMGLMDYTREAAELRAQMLMRAHIAIVLADYSKFNRTAPVEVGNFKQVRKLITDRKPDRKMAASLSFLKDGITIAKP